MVRDDRLTGGHSGLWRSFLAPVAAASSAPVTRASALAIACAMVAGCAGPGTDSKYGVSASRRMHRDGEPIPKGGGRAQVGKPYVISGRQYVPREDPTYDRTGIASWYGSDFHGRQTANGEIYDRRALSAAHTTMPLPSYARVTNLENGRSIIVRVNDRGPFVGNREIDLSERTAEMLEFKGRGLARVRVQYVGRASVDGSDDRFLAATLTDGGTSVERDRVLIASAGGKPPAEPARPTLVADASSVIPTWRGSEVPRTSLAPVARSPYERPPVGRQPQVEFEPYRKPASSASEAIVEEMGEADGAPISIVPAGVPERPGPYGRSPDAGAPRFEPVPAGDIYSRPPVRRSFDPWRTSYAPDPAARVGDAFAAFGPGQGLPADPTVTASTRPAAAAADRVTIDLGAYADAANARRLAAALGAYGEVAVRPVERAGGTRLALVSIVAPASERERVIGAARAAGVADPRVTGR